MHGWAISETPRGMYLFALLSSFVSMILTLNKQGELNIHLLALCEITVDEESIEQRRRSMTLETPYYDME